jgi:hypothetical protein
MKTETCLVFMFYFMVGKISFLLRECNYLVLDAMQLMQFEYLNNVRINGSFDTTLWLDLILVLLFCFLSLVFYLFIYLSGVKINGVL